MSQRSEPAAPRGPHILIIVQNLPVPLDRRVWLECQALVRRGYRVSVICPTGPGEPAYRHMDGVDIHTYAPAREAKGLFGFVWEFAYSWVRTAALTLRVRRTGGRFDVMQACNPPDTYWLLALLWRIAGVAFVFDHHDLNPELFRSRFGEPEGLAKSLQYRMLLWLERRSFRAAHHIISTNETYRSIAIGRGGRSPDDVTVVRSGPDTAQMRPIFPTEPRRRDTINLVYVGIMGPQDNVDKVLDIVDELVHRRGRNNITATLLGFGDCLEQLKAETNARQLHDHVTFTGRVDRAQLAEYLSRGDIGVSPDLRSPLNDVSTMNKTMEYMAYALPAVAFDLTETRVSGADTVLYAPSGDIASFADHIERLANDPALRARMGRAARERVAAELDWRPQAEAYVGVFDALTGHSAAGSAVAPANTDAEIDPWGRPYVDLEDDVAFEDYLVARAHPATVSEVVPTSPLSVVRTGRTRQNAPRR